MKRVALSLLLLAAGVTGSAGAQDTPEVREISFAGARTFDERLLRAAIVSDQTRCDLFLLCLFGTGIDRHYVDEIGLSGDLVRLRMFYYQRGFREAAIRLDTLGSDKGLELRFTIDEGRPVQVATLAVTGAEGLGGALPLAVGQPFSLLDYEMARDTLSARL
ncbi:MAG: hypothetical protein ACT443_06715, partial [Gemmatimonadota bacterium]